MARKTVITDDPDIVEFEYAEDGASDDESASEVEEVTFTTEDGEEVTVAEGERLVDADGTPVGTVDRIVHHPTDDSGWTFTPYIDYADGAVAESTALGESGKENVGGLPLGEMAKQFREGSLQHA